jgi:hypothetical protein
MHETNAAPNSLPCWRIGENVCALADSERHLGHILQVESQWIAYDGTRLGEGGVGFRLIGTFPDMNSAKVAVEFATLCISKAKGAATGLT